MLQIPVLHKSEIMLDHDLHVVRYDISMRSVAEVREVSSVPHVQA